ncbi:MAG: nickel-dependent hydrogenase large subunit [Methylococcaceae bacterium]
MNLAGNLQIDIQHQSGRVCQVTIASSRPTGIARVLCGNTPEQALQKVPLLFSLCRNAQAYAALQACQMALGIVPDTAVNAAQNLLVQVESWREQCWRILLDWPRFIGLSPDKASLAALMQFEGAIKHALFGSAEAFQWHNPANPDLSAVSQILEAVTAKVDAAVFAGELNGFLALENQMQLQHWLQKSPTVAAQLLTLVYQNNWCASGNNTQACLPDTLSAADLNQEMHAQGAEAFASQPKWQGSCQESSILTQLKSAPLIVDLASYYGNALIVRLVARLLAVASIPRQLQQLCGQQGHASAMPGAQRQNAGIGLGQVQAARGLLLHRAEIGAGLIKAYHIIAPTEWNFHPEGVVAHSLKQLQASNQDKLKAQAELIINAIDPCVQTALHFTDLDLRTPAYAG